MQTLTESGTTTDYIDKAIYEVSESERKTKIDEETMKNSRDRWCPPRAPWSEPFWGMQVNCRTLLGLFWRQLSTRKRRH